MEPKRRLLELLLSSDAPSWRVRRIVVEEHGRDEPIEQVPEAAALHLAVLRARIFNTNRCLVKGEFAGLTP